MDRQAEVYRVLTAAGHLTQTAFVDGLHALGAGLDPGALSDLFARADADGDGVVALPEWHAWADRHPAMLESLYETARMPTVDAQFEQQEDSARTDLIHACHAEAAARADLSDAAHAVAAADAECAVQRELVARLHSEEEQAGATLRMSHGELEDGRAELNQSLVALQQKHTNAAEHHRQALGCEEQLAALEAARVQKEGELRTQESRLRAIEQMLAEQQGVVAALAHAHDAAARDIDRVRSLLDAGRRQMEAEQSAAAAMSVTANTAEQQLMVLDERYAELARLQQGCEANMQAEVRRLQDGERVLGRARDVLAQQEQRVEAAVRGCADAEARVRQGQLQRAAYHAARAEAHQREVLLIREEVELCRQRDALNHKEAIIRASFTSTRPPVQAHLHTPAHTSTPAVVPVPVRTNYAAAAAAGVAMPFRQTRHEVPACPP